MSRLLGNAVVKVMYPWFIPLFFLVGPGLYGSYCSINERRNRWHIIHYLPVIIGYAILIVQLAFFNDRFYETVQLAHELTMGVLRASFGLSLTNGSYWHILFMFCCMFLVSISKLNENKATAAFIHSTYCSRRLS